MLIITDALLNILIGASVTAILKYLCEPTIPHKNFMVLSVIITIIAYILYVLQKINKYFNKEKS